MGGRGRYVGLAAIAATLAIAYGIWYAYSVILVALLNEFGWSRSLLAGAFSVFTLVHGIVSPLVGALCNRVPPRILMSLGGAALALALLAVSFLSQPWHLYAGFGVLTSMAISACGWIPALVQVQRDFRDRLGLAMGIASAGVGLGMLIVVPLFQALIDGFGWRAAFRFFALACAAWIIPSSLLLVGRAPAPVVPRPPPAGKARPAAATRAPAGALTLRQAMRSAPLWLMVAVYFLGNVAAQTLHVHQVAFLVDQGIAAMTAAAVVGVVGIASIVGKVGGGWLSDRVDREVVYVAGIAGVVLSIGVLGAIGRVPAHAAAFGYAVLFGLGYSVTASLVPAMVSDRFGGPHFGAIVGFGMVGGAIGAALGAWLAGRLFDATGSYAQPFAIAAACGLGAAGAVWWARRLRRQARNEPAREG